MQMEVEREWNGVTIMDKGIGIYQKLNPNGMGINNVLGGIGSVWK